MEKFEFLKLIKKRLECLLRIAKAIKEEKKADVDNKIDVKLEDDLCRLVKASEDSKEFFFELDSRDRRYCKSIIRKLKQIIKGNKEESLQKVRELIRDFEVRIEELKPYAHSFYNSSYLEKFWPST